MGVRGRSRGLEVRQRSIGGMLTYTYTEGIGGEHLGGFNRNFDFGSINT